MSRSGDRIDTTIARLRSSFEGTPYFKECELYEETPPETKDDLLLSVIIPARNEFPNVVHTVHSIINSLHADGFTHDQYEIIIVNNCSTDYNDPKYDWSKPGDRGTTDHLMPRGVYNARIVRVLYDPIAGNHSARNKGARIARGKYLFFSDAHMSYAAGSFKHGLKACEESGGIVHMAVAWMGGHTPDMYLTNSTAKNSIMTQYTIKLGEEWKGTWANYRPWNDNWFYIAAQGHCSLFVNRKQFLDFGGYPDVHRTYGGGEFFTNMLWWMYGSSVAVEPRAIAYHLSSSRGYSYHHDDYIHNVFNCAWALGCDDWLERTYLNYLRRGRKSVLDRMMDEAKEEMKERREEIERRRKYTFNQLLVMKPWDQANMKRGGASNSSLLIYHYTWIKGLENYPIVKELYEKSETQKKLADFILQNLHDYVYKWQEYETVPVREKASEKTTVG